MQTAQIQEYRPGNRHLNVNQSHWIIPPASLKGLSPRVVSYIRHRPRYPKSILEVLMAMCGLNRDHDIVDIGCGPGILAQLFLENGNQVIGVEPDDEMRAGAHFALQGYPRFNCMDGTAEASTLPEQCCDFVISGQAFHWFDPDKARSEFARILKPGGWIALAWNIRRKIGTPFQIALDDFWKDERCWNKDRALKYGSRAWQNERAKEEVLVPFFSPGTYQEQWFYNPISYDLEGLKGRIFSTLPALRPGEAGYGLMLRTLGELFAAHQLNGTVTFEQDTWLVYGQLTD